MNYTTESAMEGDDDKTDPNNAERIVWAVFVLLGSVGSSDGGGGGKSVSG